MSVLCVCDHHADDHDPACEVVECDCHLFRTGFEEWRDHIPSGYEDMTGYGQVSCSCGWDSSDEKLGWEEHIDAAARAVTTSVTTEPTINETPLA